MEIDDTLICGLSSVFCLICETVFFPGSYFFKAESLCRYLPGASLGMAPLLLIFILQQTVYGTLAGGLSFAPSPKGAVWISGQKRSHGQGGCTGCGCELCVLLQAAAAAVSHCLVGCCRGSQVSF